MKIAALTVSACALFASGVAAAATTPAAYRQHVNAICRSYTPALKRDAAALSNAATNKDTLAVGRSLGHLLGLALAEDKQVEAVPVPAPLRAQMTPLLALLRQADAHIRTGIARLAAGDAKGWTAELTFVGNMGPTLNAKYDAAGLRDCGSNQS